VSTPYSNLPRERFWKTGVEQSDPRQMDGIHQPGLEFGPRDVVATMGSCFAQHIANWLRDRRFNVPWFGTDGNVRSQSFSASYGNLYTVRQALQLLQEARGRRRPSEIAWAVADGFIDCLRPNVHATPFARVEDVIAARETHLADVLRVVQDLDIMVFTLGLTESWQIKTCGTVLPTAPGVIGGRFDDSRYEFVNFRYAQVLADIEALHSEMIEVRDGRAFNMILTVSPVPLTATAEDRHILQSTTYSKAVLRSVAGDFCADHAFADYFPSFEIITNPAARSDFFEDNLRSVRSDSVSTVMQTFQRAYRLVPPDQNRVNLAQPGDVDCEDVLLEAFANPVESALAIAATPPSDLKAEPAGQYLLFGDSHLTGFLEAFKTKRPAGNMSYAALNFLTEDPFTTVKGNHFRRFQYRADAPAGLTDLREETAETLIIVGCGFMGDAIVRAHGPLLAGYEGCKGEDIAPRIPIVSEVTPALRTFYDSVTGPIISRAEDIEAHTTFRRILWIGGPDMIESAARFRLGAEYVESAAHWIHREGYLQSFQARLGKLRRTRFLTHPWQTVCTASGFSDDRYRAQPKAWDVHCNGDYYAAAAAQVLADVEAMKAG
jgi:hypothetical protein